MCKRVRGALLVLAILWCQAGELPAVEGYAAHAMAGCHVASAQCRSAVRHIMAMVSAELEKEPAVTSAGDLAPVGMGPETPKPAFHRRGPSVPAPDRAPVNHPGAPRTIAPQPKPAPEMSSPPQPSAPAEVPTQSVAPASGSVPTANAPTAVDSVISSLPLGNLSYQVPEPMQVGRADSVKLLISPTKTIAELQSELEQSGQIGGAQIRVSGLMEPRLSGAEFEITPEFAEGAQAVATDATASWVWTVRPKTAGNQKLRLTVDALIEVDGRSSRRTVEVFDRPITVAVNETKNSRRPYIWSLLALGGAAVALGLYFLARWWRRRRWRTLAQQAMGPAKHADVFISYARRDSGRVLPLVERLRAQGYGVWIDVAGIDGATSWQAEIASALSDVKAVVLMASRNAFASDYVTRELLLAAEERKPLIPVYLEEAEAPAALRLQLAGVQRIDWHVPDESAYPQVLRALHRLGISAKGAPPSTAEIAAGQS